jgi:hypothetical protein
LRVSEKRAMWRIAEGKKDDVTVKWDKLRMEKGVR